MHTTKNYGGLDRFRMAAALLVVAIHTSPLISISENADFFLTRVLARIAVPFFFMLTGQFVVIHFLNPSCKGSEKVTSDHDSNPPLSAGNTPVSGAFILKKFLKKMCLLYGFCILLYLPIGIYAEHYQKLNPGTVLRMLLFDGTFYHLWYFPACIIGVALIYLLSRFLSLRAITAVSAVLYVVGLFGDSYYGLIQNVPFLSAIYDFIFQAFSYTRNGLFLAPLFLVLGAWAGILADGVKDRTDHQDLMSDCIGLVFSFFTMSGEAFLLRHLECQRHDSMYLMLIPTMFFLYQCLLASDKKSSKSLRVASAWIYILHPAFIVVVRAAAKPLQLTALLVENNLVHYFAVTLLSVAAGALIACLQSRFPRPAAFRHKSRSQKISEICDLIDMEEQNRNTQEQYADMGADETDMAGADMDADELDRMSDDVDIDANDTDRMSDEAAIDANYANTGANEAHRIPDDAAIDVNDTDRMSDEAAIDANEADRMSDNAAIDPNEADRMSDNAAIDPNEADRMSDNAAIDPNEAGRMSDNAAIDANEADKMSNDVDTDASRTSTTSSVNANAASKNMNRKRDNAYSEAAGLNTRSKNAAILSKKIVTEETGTGPKNTNIVSALRKPENPSLTRKPAGKRAWIELDSAALEQNVAFLRSLLPERCRLMPAVKAEAYGHGGVIIAELLNRMGVDAFCVACIAEGIALREAGIKGGILILGYTPPEDFSLLRRYHLTQTVVDYDYAQLMNRFGNPLHVHLAIDTGMHRLGIRCEETEKIQAVCDMENLSVDGFFTHLSVSDSLLRQDVLFTEAQIQAFYQVIRFLRKKGYPCRGLHLLASYGILNLLSDRGNPEMSGDEDAELHAAEYAPVNTDIARNAAALAGNFVRPGIALYGILSNKADSNTWRNFLQPVLSLKAKVVSVRPLYAGEATGYGAAFIAKRDMRIAALSIGYADGLPRELSYGKGSVLINGCRVPILGRICMDQTIVDVSRIPRIKPGDTAVIIGKSGKLENTADSLATQCGTITNELLSRLGSRLDRIVLQDKQKEQENI